MAETPEAGGDAALPRGYGAVNQHYFQKVVLAQVRDVSFAQNWCVWCTGSCALDTLAFGIFAETQLILRPCAGRGASKTVW